jgi:hypothetical protein
LGTVPSKNGCVSCQNFRFDARAILFYFLRNFHEPFFQRHCPQIKGLVPIPLLKPNQSVLDFETIPSKSVVASLAVTLILRLPEMVETNVETTLAVAQNVTIQ